MYFDNYRDFPDATLNRSLLWEYEADKIDLEKMRDIIVQRVVERGWPADWYAILNLYGLKGVKQAIKNIPYLNEKDMNFVKVQLDIPLSAMKCYKNKQSTQAHWNS